MSEGEILWSPAIAIHPSHLSPEQLKALNGLVESKHLMPTDVAYEDDCKSLIIFWSVDPQSVYEGNWKRPILINNKRTLDCCMENKNICGKNKQLFVASRQSFMMILAKYSGDEELECYNDAIIRINKKIDGDICELVPALKDKSKCIMGEYLVYLLI